MKRYLEGYILEDLDTKMVFLGGPRQVGKTTFCRNLLKNHFSSGKYYNWDAIDDRMAIENQQFSVDDNLLVLDELHKKPLWKNYIKGLYDKKNDKHKFLITGSARLDMYQKGGDSLLGRYHYYRLHPFSIAEILEETFDVDMFLKQKELSFSSAHKKQKKAHEILLSFMEKGGFPEPFLGENKRTQLRWSHDRKRHLLREDIRDVSFIKRISDLEKLMIILPEKIGSLFSIRSLQEDLAVSQPTITEWMKLLENFYYIFRLSPFSASTIKSLRKEQKVFLWDYSELQDEGAKFENLVGSHLIKWVHFLQDTYGVNIELHYLRDREKREVDFCISLDGEILMAIEVKLSTKKISKHLKYFQKKMDIPYCFQIIKTPNIDFEENNIRVMSAGKFLGALV